MLNSIKCASVVLIHWMWMSMWFCPVRCTVYTRSRPMWRKLTHILHTVRSVLFGWCCWCCLLPRNCYISNYTVPEDFSDSINISTVSRPKLYRQSFSLTCSTQPDRLVRVLCPFFRSHLFHLGFFLGFFFFCSCCVLLVLGWADIFPRRRRRHFRSSHLVAFDECWTSKFINWLELTWGEK